MRKLDKQIKHATEYDAWQKSNPNADYKSSKDPFYVDVLLELLIAQGGLCAYTELRLLAEDQTDLLPTFFEAGKAKISNRPQVFCDLEHFNSADKKSSGWNWNNLFAVWDSVNKKKRVYEAKHGIDPILKPDNSDYEPFEFLAYNAKRHAFVPNPKQPKDIQDRVEKMIAVLCLNFGTVLEHRKIYLESQMKISQLTGLPPQIHQFPTAFAMIQRNLSR